MPSRHCEARCAVAIHEAGKACQPPLDCRAALAMTHWWAKSLFLKGDADVDLHIIADQRDIFGHAPIAALERGGAMKANGRLARHGVGASARELRIEHDGLGDAQ